MRTRSSQPSFSTCAALMILGCVSLVLAVGPALGQDDGALQTVGNWSFGGALAVAYDAPRNLAYIGSGGAVIVLDLADPAAPQLVSDSLDSQGLVTDLAYDAATRRLYVAAGVANLQIWDLADPAAPQLLGTGEINATGLNPPVQTVELFGDFALVEGDWIGAASFDVSDPAQPVLVDINSSAGSSTADISVSADGYLHMLGSEYYAAVPIEPDGTLPGFGGFPIGNARVVFGTPDAAFVERYGELLIFDRQNYGDYSSTEVGYFYDMVVADGLAYLAASSALNIWDVSDLAAPTFTGTLAVPAGKVDLSGSVAYLAGGADGLNVVDVSDPTQPVEIGGYAAFGSSRRIVRSGDHGYVTQGAAGVVVLDLADLAAPHAIARHDTPGYAVDVAVVGDRAYVADREGGLRILDVSDPAGPVELGAAAVASADVVVATADRAYVVDDVLNEPDWIRIYDVTDPAAVTELGAILMQSEVDALDVTGDLLFAAADDLGLRVLDVSNPASPVEIGSYVVENTWDVHVRGDRAFLASADWNGGLVILDVADPTAPQLLGNYVPSSGWYHPFDLAIAGDFAYLSSPVPSSGQLVAVYVADPTAPVEVADYSLPGDVADIAATDSLVYVADGNAGVRVLHNTLYSLPGGGVGWRAQDSGTSASLRAVDFTDTQTGWVAGDGGTILHTENAGAQWLPQDSGTTEDLFAVFFLDAMTGWFGGREGVIRKTTDGGATWTPQTSGTGEQIRGIVFVDAGRGWAVGGGGTILTTADGGETWQAQTSGTEETLMAVCFVDADHGWATGGSGDAAVVLRTTNGGAEWLPSTTPEPRQSLNSVHFVDEQVGWVCGYHASVYKSTDGGVTWQVQYQDLETDYTNFSDVYAINANTAWAVGYVGVAGRSVKTSDRGDTWVDIYGGTDEILQSVDFVDQNNGWAVGHWGTIYAATSNTGPEDAVTGIAEEPAESGTPDGRLRLAQNYPNPFNPQTTLVYDLPAATTVSLRIYDLAGRLVRALTDGAAEPAGHHEVVWDGRDGSGRALASGVYFYNLRAGGSSETRRMVLVR